MPERKLSIITVNLNNGEGLMKTINSVLEQSSRDFEFVVIDGASTDNSPAIVAQFEKEFTYSISEKDTGIYNAMNKGIKRSTGDYLLFLNSGDWLHDTTVIERLLPQLNGADVISGDIEIFDNKVWHSMSSDDKISVDLFMRLSLYHQATFISRKLFDTYGLYDESFRSAGDYEFFIRTLLKNNGTYSHIQLKISNFVADGMSNDPALFAANMAERERAWDLNFSKNIIDELKAYYQLANSKELGWGRKLNKLIPF